MEKEYTVTTKELDWEEFISAHESGDITHDEYYTQCRVVLKQMENEELTDSEREALMEEARKENPAAVEATFKTKVQEEQLARVLKKFRYILIESEEEDIQEDVRDLHIYPQFTHARSQAESGLGKDEFDTWHEVSALKAQANAQTEIDQAARKAETDLTLGIRKTFLTYVLDEFQKLAPDCATAGVKGLDVDSDKSWDLDQDWRDSAGNSGQRIAQSPEAAQAQKENEQEAQETLEENQEESEAQVQERDQEEAALSAEAAEEEMQQAAEQLQEQQEEIQQEATEAIQDAVDKALKPSSVLEELQKAKDLEKIKEKFAKQAEKQLEAHVKKVGNVLKSAAETLAQALTDAESGEEVTLKAVNKCLDKTMRDIQKIGASMNAFLQERKDKILQSMVQQEVKKIIGEARDELQKSTSKALQKVSSLQVQTETNQEALKAQAMAKLDALLGK